MPEDERPSIIADVTCRAEGCPVAGETFRVKLYENVNPPIYRAQCGPCGNTTPEIVEVPNA